MAKQNQEIEEMTYKILVLQGPNLNLLGQRETSIYGEVTLEELHIRLEEDARVLGMDIQFYQSNHEGYLIDRIHEGKMDSIHGIIINPGGLTHTSVALRDALVGVDLPFVEIHISNIYSREPFRHHSYLSDRAIGVIAGFGLDGYRLALRGLVDYLTRGNNPMDMRE